MSPTAFQCRSSALHTQFLAPRLPLTDDQQYAGANAGLCKYTTACGRTFLVLVLDIEGMDSSEAHRAELQQVRDLIHVQVRLARR